MGMGMGLQARLGLWLLPRALESASWRRPVFQRAALFSEAGVPILLDAACAEKMGLCCCSPFFEGMCPPLQVMAKLQQLLLF